MKAIKILVVVVLFAFLSCQKNESAEVNGGTNKKQQAGNVGGTGINNLRNQMRLTSGPFSQYISIDTANRMISSYLSSINYPDNTDGLQSLIFNADSLRNYLNDTTHGKIIQVKFMLAHTTEYINAGNFGVNAGYETGDLTIIVAGYDQNNNYVYRNGNLVLEHAMPCPYACPSSGTAAFPVLH